ncbi:hypothetical protein NDU88_005554, partial [Pleurodeles waltl]
WHNNGRLTLANPMNSLPPLSALVDRRPHHRNNRPPAPHPLQKENHPTNRPCD